MEEPMVKPGIVQLAYRYTRALSRWIKAGRPVRQESEIVFIYREHCRPCEVFDETSSTCHHCGCRVNESVIAPVNKIAMQTEHCPIDKW